MNEITRPIEVITQEINFYKSQAGNAIIEIGKRLHEAKLTLPHGAWGAWLQNEVEFSERTAQNFMRIAKEYRNPQLIADMGNSATKALLLLSLPAEEREEFVGEAHEIDGEEKTVAAMTTKEMERLLKELEAERAEKEKLQSQLDLFQTEKDNAVDAAYKETEDKLDALVSQKEAAEQAKREAEERIAAMETEMDELRMQAEQTALPRTFWRSPLRYGLLHFRLIFPQNQALRFGIPQGSMPDARIQQYIVGASLHRHSSGFLQTARN